VKKLLFILQYIAAITLVAAHNCLRLSGFGQFSVPLYLCVVAEEESVDKQILKSLGGLNERLKQLDEMQKSVTKNAADYEIVTKITAEVKLELDNFRRQQLSIKSGSRISPSGQVSEECARFLGGLVLAAGINQGKFSGRQLEFAESEMKNILGVHQKAALTSTDIPLPTLYAGDIVELVYTYGFARKFGTVYPLGALTVKLPKLTTDPVFGLIAASGTVTEKSPQVGFVTFTSEKFGGLVRLPSEIEEDSVVAMGQFLARYCARNIAAIEDWQFFCSTGGASGQNGTAKGLLISCNAANDNVQYICGGSTSSGKTAISGAVLGDYRSLRAQVSGAVLGNAKYYMHPTFEQALVAFNTSATVTPYIRGTKDTPATLDGFPIIWEPSMPVYTSTPSATTGYVLFGDVSYEYLGVRSGVRFDTSREAAFTTDEILVRCLERLTVGKMATAAIAVLVTSTT
jgi:HK97 family phage major capsid protein